MTENAERALVVVPVTPDRWADLVELFERPGPRGGMPIPGSCWCMAYRGNAPSREVRKQAMRDLVTSGRRPGLLAYADGTPVGWVAVAPRVELGGAGRSRLFAGPERDSADDADGANVFAITCFYVDPDVRGDGVASALLDAAIEDARARGATDVEAYPKTSLAPHATQGGRAEENFSFMGRPGSFERRGFTPVRDAGSRVVVRRAVSG